jgi:hypothetical protein
MNKSLTVPSSLISVRADGPLTPAMTALIWRIANALDEKRINPAKGDAVWLSLPTASLRGAGARDDNVWLRQLLRRLRKIELEGVEKDSEWAAQLVAQEVWEDGGRIVRLLLPPAAVAALNAPKTFAKIEEQALVQLPPHARKLYALLADKKRLRRPSWRFDLGDLKMSLGVDGKRSYDRFNSFRQRVLDPAVMAINDLGTVEVAATPDREGRSVVAVRFDWRWKGLGSAAETVVENERHSTARRKRQTNGYAPPMIDDKCDEAALDWWSGLTPDERTEWSREIGTTMTLEMPGGRVQTTPRRESDIARAAHKKIFGAGQ